MRHSIHPLSVERHGNTASRRTAAATRFALPAQPAPCPANAIERLLVALDAAFDACGDAIDPSHAVRFARALRAALVEAAGDPELLAPAQREGAADKYRRHLLAADPLGRYAVASLVWLPGQMSPVHAHHTWCGYVVLDGTLSESIYDWNETYACAEPIRTQARESGAVSYTRAGRGCIHRLGNTSEAPAISLHVYGVQETQFATHVNDVVRCAEFVKSTLAPAALPA
jgi:predicted metal-dependent enzyme (double-stranded beta helix superfamily)